MVEILVYVEPKKRSRLNFRHWLVYFTNPTKKKFCLTYLFTMMDSFLQIRPKKTMLDFFFDFGSHICISQNQKNFLDLIFDCGWFNLKIRLKSLLDLVFDNDGLIFTNPARKKNLFGTVFDFGSLTFANPNKKISKNFSWPTF